MASSLAFDEREILIRVSARDSDAFEILYHRYAKKIYVFALKTLRSEESAEEVVQELMLKIWCMGPALTSIDNLEVYLRTAARNHSLNLLRKQETATRAGNARLQNWNEETNDTEERIILNDTQRILNNAIAMLPGQQREVFRLCHQEGLKHGEVAQQLKLAPSTVATHLKLALRFLRTYMRKQA